jgi:hypothetical protein
MAAAALLGAAAGAWAPMAWAQAPGYRFAHSDDPVADHNAYLLTLLASDPAARRAVAAEPALQQLWARLAGTRGEVLAACRALAATACPVARLMLSDGEIGSSGEALARLAAGPLRALVRDQMRPSGRFQKYAGLDDAGLIRAAWAETAQGVNRLYRVYGLAEKPRYPEIDAASYAPGDRYFRSLEAAALEAETDGAGQPFFSPWAGLGFDLMVINQRDEAARYEPLETGENAAATARAKKLDWRAKPYAAIVVPGQGLEGAETGLSPGGAFRIRLAVRRWREGAAPFIVVSGGHVHPNKTAFAEAVEMKRALVGQYGVPAEAVVIDPYARHTTTNLRNAVRLMFRLGAPAGKALLITTSGDQSRYIESAAFAQRNTAELGYQPVTGLKRVSPFDLAGVANLTSLHADPQDPLDP